MKTFAPALTSNGFTGTAPAGSIIEAIDLSTAVSQHLSIDESKPLGTVDSTESFTFNLDGLHGGDFVRVRAKLPDGSYSPWQLMRVPGVDTYSAPVVAPRLQLYEDGAGGAVLRNPELDRPAAEPYAKLRLTNMKSGAKLDVTLDELGRLPSNLTLSGSIGELFSIAATDGASNTDFLLSGATLEVVGKITHSNDIADPRPTKDYIDQKGRITVGMAPFNGPLIVNDMTPDDVRQGYIGDCYLPAAFASAVKYNPDVVQKMIKKNDDGSYTVTFQERQDDGTFAPHEVRIDSDLYYDSSKEPIFAKSLPDQVQNMELWWPLIEKAYAEWKGSYEDIGNGGESNDVFEAIYGRDGIYQDIGSASDAWKTTGTTPADLAKARLAADDLWKTITAQVDAKKPGALGTGAEGPRYDKTGVHGNHAYSILGYEIDAQTKQRYVVLRNPWGFSEPGDEDGGDGVFKLPIEDAVKLYDQYYSVS